MFKKILPILALGCFFLWGVNGNAEDFLADEQQETVQSQPMKQGSNANPQPCPVKTLTIEVPCECPPKPCCVPKPKCVRCSPCPIKDCIDDCGGFYVTADFLWWRAENHGLSYAFDNEVNSSDFPSGKIVRVNPHWDPGFRVGLGWNTEHDFLDLLVDWTWYRNHSSSDRSHSSLAALSNEGFYPLYPVEDSASNGNFRNVSADYTLNLNVIDFEMGRGLFISKYLGIRPLLGVRGAYLKQKFHDHFSSALDATSTGIDELKFDAHNRFWGVGPRAGLNGEWEMGCGFSIIGKTSASLLYGKTHVKAETDESTTTSSAFVLQNSYTDHFWQLAPTLQLLFGFQYATCFWCDTYFAVSASWEANYWWDQCNVPVPFTTFTAPMPTVGNQPVTMEGLTVNMEWDF
ncbi:MAG TPA: Lpg1974 family pore-forming outer membrane protein [Chlamydiales bacterium]|nr:Lpg1974 family pore-forming outer membrane protein [Chlamydiales bacterium]